MSEHWVYGAIGLLLVLHVVVLVRAYRRSGETAGGHERFEEYVTADGVECPDCGSHNSRDYRYCRNCVSELPGQVSLLGQSTRLQGRRTL